MRMSLAFRLTLLWLVQSGAAYSLFAWYVLQHAGWRPSSDRPGATAIGAEGLWGSSAMAWGFGVMLVPAVVAFALLFSQWREGRRIGAVAPSPGPAGDMPERPRRALAHGFHRGLAIRGTLVWLILSGIGVALLGLHLLQRASARIVGADPDSLLPDTLMSPGSSAMVWGLVLVCAPGAVMVVLLVRARRDQRAGRRRSARPDGA